jgi:hypothetical protein
MKSFAVRALLLIAASLLLFGCASPLFDVGRSETVLPLSRAWIDGRLVEYVTTDVSDADTARMIGVNYAPRLAQGIKSAPGQSVLERVYKFEAGKQFSVFQSAPQPVGPESQDKSYSPLWRLVHVRWVDGAAPRELRSEEQILAAEERGQIRLEVTDIVVNCPITREVGGVGLRGVR